MTSGLQNSRTLLFIAALVASAPSLARAQSEAAPSKKETPIYTWEHKCIGVEWSKALDLETFANSMGLASWELVGFPSPLIMCFKRRRLDPNTPEGKLRVLNDRMSKLTIIHNEGRLTEAEYKKRIEAIERERSKLLILPDEM